MKNNNKLLNMNITAISLNAKCREIRNKTDEKFKYKLLQQVVTL